jgi:hypothetical protein
MHSLKNRKHYVSNKVFTQLLIDYSKTKSKRILNDICKCFILIAQNYCNRPNFINYSQDRKDEMVSDAYYTMLINVYDFNINKQNPFAYFSKIAQNCFLQYIKKYKKYRQQYVSIDLIEQIPEFTISNNDNTNKYEKTPV